MKDCQLLKMFEAYSRSNPLVVLSSNHLGRRFRTNSILTFSRALAVSLSRRQKVASILAPLICFPFAS